MEKICKNCGAENQDNSKFCKECGAELDIHPNIVKKTGSNNDDKSKIIIIALIAIIAIMLVGLFAFASGMFSHEEVPLETMEFDEFKILMPVGASFTEINSIPEFQNIGGLINYKNNGAYSEEVSTFGVSKMGPSVPSEVKFDRSEGDVQIFKDKDLDDLYFVARQVDNYSFSLMGSDVDTMVKILNSVEITGSSAKPQETTTQTTQTETSAPTTTAMSILGGSFSTGSGLSDKTYASIYVGPEHAGENVKIQIWYSRDGSTLNNGNMVPKTVDSSGYINVRSADAYSKYPDYAEVNVYDTSGNLLDSVSVTLTPDSGTQNF